jgi:restriction endonuclease
MFISVYIISRFNNTSSNKALPKPSLADFHIGGFVLFFHFSVSRVSVWRSVAGRPHERKIVVYAKLPDGRNGFKIHTPMGEYTPDWAVVFEEGAVRHVYFVAETKGSLKSSEIRPVEEKKIECAKRHFEAIQGGDAIYGAVRSFEDLMDIVG